MERNVRNGWLVAALISCSGGLISGHVTSKTGQDVQPARGPVKVLQDDIVVKPGAGGGNLVWYSDNLELDAGNPGVLRDDFQGRIGKFEIFDTSGVPCAAAWATFEVKSETYGKVKVRIERNGEFYEWATTPRRNLRKCSHDASLTPACQESGIPEDFYGQADGKLRGKCVSAGGALELSAIRICTYGHVCP